jgi:hypothetical protein
MLEQATNKLNTNLYPYTEINPYAPWYSRIKTLWFGETPAEFTARTKIAKEMWDEIMPYARDNRLSVPSVPASPLINNEWTMSPILGNLNLTSTFQTASTVVENIMDTPLSIHNKLASIPGTPRTLLTALPEAAVPSWVEHAVSQTELNDYVDKVRLGKIKELVPPTLSEASSSLIKNKSRVLSELEYFDLS